MADRFEICVEKLLNGEVICEQSSPEEMRYLENQEHLNRVNNFLMQLRRMINKTSDKRGFYCVYTDLSDSDRRHKVRAQLDEAVCDFNGLVDWLRLCRNVSADGRPLEAGDILRESELLSAIENSNTLCQQLERIADKFQRARKAMTTNNRLRSILDYLINKGYFVQANSTGSVYIATAKWSLLYLSLIHI